MNDSRLARLNTLMMMMACTNFSIRLPSFTFYLSNQSIFLSINYRLLQTVLKPSLLCVKLYFLMNFDVWEHGQITLPRHGPMNLVANVKTVFMKESVLCGLAFEPRTISYLASCTTKPLPVKHFLTCQQLQAPNPVYGASLVPPGSPGINKW